MPVTANKPAPYATAGSILDLVNRYRSRGLPAPVDADVLGRVGIAQTLIARTLQALHALDLVDAKTGAPTATFEALRLAPEDEFQKRLAEWLKGAYADVFSVVDPMKDGDARIRDAFRTYQPVGQQERMKLLFQGLCTAAGLMAPKAPKAASLNATASAPQPRAAAKRAASPRVNDASRRSTGNNTEQRPVPQPLMGLLSSLPPEGEGWTSDRRDKFLVAFETLLDFCVPIVPYAASESDEEAA